jgi:purine-nucleoside phosphorylase
MSEAATVQNMADVLLERLPRLARCRVAMVLGSGLGAFADELKEVETLPYSEVPRLPAPSVEGHAGQFLVGRLGRHMVAVLQGRVHLYEGYKATEVVRAARALNLCGVDHLVLTNAAGAIRGGLHVGDIVLLRDHLNLSGQNPMTGPPRPEFGARFPDCSDIYNKELRAEILAACEKKGVPLAEGVYACLLGGSYETPAEIRMLAAMGADLVGMSTALEAIAANAMGTKVVAMSFVTNIAAGLSASALDHAEVTEAAAAVEGRLASALRVVVRTLHTQAGPRS